MNPLLALGLAAGWIGGLFAVASQTTVSSREIKLERGKVYRIQFQLPATVSVVDAGVPRFFRDLGFALTGGLEAFTQMPDAPAKYNAFGVWSAAEGANPVPLMRTYIVNGNELVVLNIGPV